MSQRLVPTYCNKGELLAALDDIRASVEANDSFEGSLSYELPWDGDPEPSVDPGDGQPLSPGELEALRYASGPGFRVRASYRTGNSMGQGGMRIIGEWAEVPADM